MSDNTTPRATGEPVAWALCDDEGVFDVEQDEALAREWVRGGADWGLVRWLRPLVFGDAHPSAAGVSAARVNELLEDLDDAVCARESAWHDLASRAEREAVWKRYKEALAAIETALTHPTTPTRGSDE